MVKRALVEKRPLLLASLVAALAFYGLRNGALPGVYLMLLKGAPMALLAAYALLRHRGADSRMIAGVMAVSALADMALEVVLEAGAAVFLLAHVIAIVLYLRHRRPRLTGSQRITALALLLLTPLIGWTMTRDPLVVVYALGLGAMAAAAWTSSFSRYQVGIGAVLYVLSDLLIFAQLGPLAASPLPNALIWPLYYCGQLLVCTGVVGELRRRAVQD